MPNEPAEIVHLSPVEIWYLYKSKILLYGGILVAALVIFGGFQLRETLRTNGSLALYANAKTAEEFQAVLQKYPGTIAAGNAALRLADLLRTDKKYDESVAVLRAFVEKYPTHPLAAGGWLSLASTYEAQGKLDEALDANNSAISKYPDAYATPIAMMAQARIYLLKGQKDDARRTYMDVASRFQQSLYARQAQRELLFIQK
ncbi:MAG: tetratricopeptide repeat protein [Chthoniobacteraceae bacterium]|nr:tetratricopeptide repeat protein [Chthoniobacteraceae bacterium]